MRDLKNLRAYWSNNSDQKLMLCTIVRKNGSGYRTISAKKIIRHDSDSCGYLSGGCLEGDIVRTALERWNEAPFLESFSTLSESDRLMGYQTGCAGIIEILFEHLPNDIQFMDNYFPFGPKHNIEAVAVNLDAEKLGQRNTLQHQSESTDTLFIDPWIEPIELYVIGCGANAHPFADIAMPLGWDVIFLDYRTGNIIPERPGVQSHILPLDQIGRSIPEKNQTAVVVMTHNYEADLAIMGQLNKKDFGYIGCVGPRKRFDQMHDDLKSQHNIILDKNWAKQVHAPAGLKQARTPEDIAFSIIAEIQFGLAT